MNIDKEELKKKLTEEEYNVAVLGGTERPFTGELLDEKREGTFSCKVCGNSLFASGTKFDSGSGWPSFDEALPGAVELVPDDALGMRRTEAKCANCGAHLGHVFPDGPTATGERYCMNSVCLTFKEEVDREEDKEIQENTLD
jgi:peptide-methionine (R)-S-oxide reductase